MKINLSAKSGVVEHDGTSHEVNANKESKLLATMIKRRLAK